MNGTVRRALLPFLSMLVVFSMLLSACGGNGTDPTATSDAAAAAPTATSAAAGDTATNAPAADPATAEPATAAPAADVVTLKMWHMPNGAAPAEAVQAEIDAFQVANPNIKVEAEMLDWGAAFQRIQTSVQGGEGPCITQLGTTWNPTFA